jgi:hypothetical protein
VVSCPQISPPKPSSFLPHTCHVTLLNLSVVVIIGKEHRFWRSSLCSLFTSPVTSSLLGPNIFFSTLFSNILSVCPSLSARDQVWCQYKTTGKIIQHFVIRTKSFFFFLNNQPDAKIIQIYSVIKLYTFQASSLPIIRSYLLYIQHWWVSCSFLMTASKQSQDDFHPDSAWKWSSKTCMKLTSAECTVDDFWWRTELLPETCRVL